MKTIELNGSHGRSCDDFYDAFFAAVGSPKWHGRNFNALRDSIAGRQVNDIEIPYSIHIRGMDEMSPNVQQLVTDFRTLIHELRSEGYDVDIRLDD